MNVRHTRSLLRQHIAMHRSVIQCQDIGPADDELNLHSRRGKVLDPSTSKRHPLRASTSSRESRPIVISADKTSRSVAQLRCKRCRRRRSPAYHRRHSQDPVANPSEGICSRRRTGCATEKLVISVDVEGQMVSELPANELILNSDSGYCK